MSGDNPEEFFKPSTESSEQKLDKSRMASTELPGRGEFFIHTTTSNDEEYGAGGAVWVVESRALDTLAQNGNIDDVLNDPKLKDAAEPFMIMQAMQGESPGLLIDFYNDPGSALRDPFDQERGNAFGIVDTLGNTSERDPLRSSVRETLNGVLRVRSAQILRVNPNAQRITILNAFFDDTRHPNKVVDTIFEGLDYETTKVTGGTLSEYAVEVSLPIGKK